VDRRTRNLFALALVAVIAVTGGASLIFGGGGGPTGPGGSGGSGGSGQVGPPGTTAVVGAIVAVDARGLGDVRGFTLRRVGGQLIDFDLGRLENGVVFPPGHLAEHQATAAPVRVWYLDEGGVRYAIRLEDAGT
jgi:hypothetical protein